MLTRAEQHRKWICIAGNGSVIQMLYAVLQARLRRRAEGDTTKEARRLLDK
jgi:hypothetical protein